MKTVSWAGAAAVAIAIAGCGGGAEGSGTGAHAMPSRTKTAQRTAPRRLRAKLAEAMLPAALSGEAATRRGRDVLVIGGLDASGTSTSRVLNVAGGPGGAEPAGSLAAPLHDAAAATVGKTTLVFGGGTVASTDAVESLVPGGTAMIVGSLPTVRSDLSAVAVGGRAYVLGGYDGTTPQPVALETTEGRSFRAVASLPRPVRYAAVAAVGPVIYAAGGELAGGGSSDSIQAIDVRSGRARIAGTLPAPLAHASAVALGRLVYVLGGTTAGGAVTGQIVSFDPSTGRTMRVARLPYAVTNAAAATSSGRGYLVGGLGASGAPLRSIVSLRLARGG